MAKIKKIIAREILDSRGQPTVEAKIFLDNNLEETASVPAGTSRGSYEALELRDGDFSRFNGQGVLKACQNIKEIISPNLSGLEVTHLKEIDQKLIELDGTKNKSRLGANAILACSLVCARAGAKATHLPLYRYLREIFKLDLLNYQLPIPLFNLINGGRHADSNLEIQEFLIFPKGKEKIARTIQKVVEIFFHLRGILKSRRGTSKAVGDEGGLVPSLLNNEEGLKFLVEATEMAGYKFGQDFYLGLDCAASEFYDQRGYYRLEGKELSRRDLSLIYQNWIKKYPLKLLEDPLEENDFSGWQRLKDDLLKMQEELFIIGDDLLTTNIERLKISLKFNSANGIVIKPNQIGTISETIECIKLARENNYKIEVAHRSGETNDDFIVDLAVAINADFIKAGGPTRGERMAKYNRLMAIEEEIENS
ncbi:MAG: phosphopyruvate hydratase [Patescibacteria group bacterium]|nr:phosphopyruvate hydratase [Patescibacteria group bacterium]